jgi:hypothetical protein
MRNERLQHLVGLVTDGDDDDGLSKFGCWKQGIISPLSPS